MDKLRVLVFDDPRYTARAHYRNINPLVRLAKTTGKMEVDGPHGFPDTAKTHPEILTPRFIASDWVYSSQVFAQEQLHTLSIAKEFGCKVWVDYDDDYSGVSQFNNPAFGNVNAQRTAPIFAKAMQLADVVTFSTEFLMQKHNKGHENKCYVINNAYDDYLFSDVTSYSGPRARCIYWRGSPTHGGDLYTVAPQIVQLSYSLDIPWRFNCPYGSIHFGDEMNPANVVIEVQEPEGAVKTNDTRAAIMPPKATTDYFKGLKALAPLLTIVPLKDNDFNRSKSNIAWIEATSAGSVVVAPDLPEFDQPGVITYSNPKGFKTQIERALNGKVNLAKANQESRAAIADGYLLSQTNEQRAKILGL